MKMKTLACVVFAALACAGLGACARSGSLVIYAAPGPHGVFWAEEAGGVRSGGLGALTRLVSGELRPRLFLCGDGWFLGTPEGVRDKGLSAARLMKECGFDAVLAGPDESTFGQKNLQYIVKVSSLPAIGTIARSLRDARPLLPPALVRDYGLFRVAVLGLSGDRAVPQAQKSEVEQAREQARKLRQEGAEFVVAALSCAWQEKPKRVRQRAGDLAAAVPELSLVIAFSRMQTEVEVFKSGQAWVAICPPDPGHVLRLELALSPASDSIKSIEAEQVALDVSATGEDENISRAADALRRDTDATLGRRVTTAEEDLALGEPVGNWAADCLMRWGKGQAAFLNKGALRSPVRKGVVTEKNLYQLYPQDDTVMVVKIRGAELRQALELNLESPAGPPYAAGLSIYYDPRGTPGYRIRKILLDGAPLSDARVYKILATDYMLAGGEGGAGLSQAVEFANTHEQVRKILRWCMARSRSIAPPADDRWLESAP